jgi:hypothetical protein
VSKLIARNRFGCSDFVSQSRKEPAMNAWCG